MKIQFHRIDTNVVVGLLVREFCCSGTDVSAKVLAMYAGTRTPSMEPQWLAAGLSQLSDEYAKYAERILKYGAWWEDEYADLIKHKQLVEHEIEKVIFLDIDGVLNDEGLLYDEGH